MTKPKPCTEHTQPGARRFQRHGRLFSLSLFLILPAIFLLSSAPTFAQVAFANKEAPKQKPIPNTSASTSSVSSAEIDRLILAPLQEAKLKPAPLSTDEAFLRRAYLDVVGVIPQCSDVKAFLNDKAPQKRARLIDDLLASERYGLHWSVMWGDLLREHFRAKGQEGTVRGSYRKWIQKNLNENVPYDQFVTDLITARGTVEDNAAVNFYLRDPNQRSETINMVSSVFMGTRMQCAQCHDHPFDKWEQNDFHSLMAFLASRTVVMPDPEQTLNRLLDHPRITGELKAKLGPVMADAREKLDKAKAQKTIQPKGKYKGKPRKPRPITQVESLRIQYQALRKAITQPVVELTLNEKQRLANALNQQRISVVLDRQQGEYRMPGDGTIGKNGRKVPGEMVKPAFPWDKQLTVSNKESRPAQLAKFITGSRLFAKVHVNRLWHRLFGRGLVHPVDDFRAKNTPSHPELLEYLADELIRSKFDSKHVLRLILNSKAYQRSSMPVSEEKDHEYLFARQRLRKMTAEQLSDSIMTATGYGKRGIETLEKPRQMGYLMNFDMGGYKPNTMEMEDAGEGEDKSEGVGWSADLPTPARSGTFLHSFNQPAREQIVCERTTNGSITQALELLNGNGSNVLTRNRPESLTRKILKARMKVDAIGEEIYLAYLSRYPTAREKKLVREAFIGKKKKAYVETIEDLQWVLLNTREFKFIR